MFNQMMQAFEREFIGQSKIWHPVSESIYHGRMSDAEIEAMRERNEQAIKKCIKEMGDKWVLHKSHQVKKNVSQQ
jgi:hypothetical protein